MQKSRMAFTGRILIGLGLIVLLAVGCNSKKGSTTGPNTQPVLVREWPSTASGIYQIQIDAWACGLFRCNWDSAAVYVDTICEFPFQYETDTANGFILTSIEGVISDTLVDVQVIASLELDDGSVCDITVVISTAETGLPPAHDGWQVISEPTFSGCEGLYGTKIRYTFTRIGDVDCFVQPKRTGGDLLALPLREFTGQRGRRDSPDSSPR